MPGRGIPSKGDTMQSDRTSARDQKCSIFSLHRPDTAVASAKKIGVWSGLPVPRRVRDLGVEEAACALKSSPEPTEISPFVRQCGFLRWDYCPAGVRRP